MTVEEIRHPTFYPTGRGTYKPTEVQEYVKSVSDSYEKLLNEMTAFDREKRELLSKIKLLTDKVEEYRLDEDNIKITLLNAQRMADKTVKKALADAQTIRDEAEEKAKKEFEGIKAQADNYALETTRKADDYLQRTKTDYDAKLATLNTKAQQIIFEANGKADYIISDAKIRSAAAIEKANSELAVLKDECERVSRMAKQELSSIKAEALSYKNEMQALIAKQSAAIESAAFPVLAAPAVDDTTFLPVHSEVSEQVNFVAHEVEEVLDKSADVAEEVPVEEPAAKAVEEPIAETEPEAVPEVTQSSVFETVNTKSEEAEDTKAEEAVEIPDVPESKVDSVAEKLFNDTFINISSFDNKTNDEDSSAEENEKTEDEVLSYEQAQAKPDLLELLSQRASEEDEEDDSDDVSQLSELEEEPEESEDYAQPSLFDTSKRGEALKERMSSFLSADDAAEPKKEEKVSSVKGEPLKFGKEFDIFNDDTDTDTFFDKYKKKK